MVQARGMEGGGRSPRRSPAIARALLLPVLVGLLLPGPVMAQEAASGFRQRVLLENEHAYAVENTYEPGAASPLHTHRFARVAYVVEGGTLELVPEDGKASRIDLQPGLTVWLPPETHVVKNVGDSRVRVVEVEIKSADQRAPDAHGSREP